jgi:putative transcriptional regulator
MLKIHLSKLMGERRLKISDVSRETGISRGALTRIYNETAERLDVEALVKLCDYFECTISELLEHTRDQAK